MGEGVRAESAGSSANRRCSSVNGVNEEWEQTKCAEMREVPPHCIGRCSLCVSSTQSHRHKHSHTLTAAFYFFHCSPAILLCSPHFQNLLTQTLSSCTVPHLCAQSATFSLALPNTLTYAHLHTFVACPLSICFLLSPHKDCSPLTIPWWADTLWHHCACVRGEEIFSDAMRTSHPADKADGLTGPCGDTNTASAHLLLAQ